MNLGEKKMTALNFLTFRKRSVNCENDLLTLFISQFFTNFNSTVYTVSYLFKFYKCHFIVIEWGIKQYNNN
jgi:hypothetical protein